MSESVHAALVASVRKVCAANGYGGMEDAMGMKQFGKYLFRKHKPREFYSQGRELSDVYGSFSDAKRKAYYACLRMYDELDGWGFCIVSHNTFSFCVTFRFVDPETGEIVQAYITPLYNYYWYV